MQFTHALRNIQGKNVQFQIVRGSFTTHFRLWEHFNLFKSLQIRLKRHKLWLCSVYPQHKPPSCIFVPHTSCLQRSLLFPHNTTPSTLRQADDIRLHDFILHCFLGLRPPPTFHQKEAVRDPQHGGTVVTVWPVKKLAELANEGTQCSWGGKGRAREAGNETLYYRKSDSLLAFLTGHPLYEAHGLYKADFSWFVLMAITFCFN
jgi:hypothetical protein